MIDKMEKINEIHSIKVRLVEENSLKSERFIIRDLSNRDVNERYLSWIQDKTMNTFILSSGSNQNIIKLKTYVRKRSNQDTVRFFGIFDKISKIHIGNIKYEAINLSLNYAIMGVLIGDINYRGIGAFKEVYSLSSQYIRSTYKIEKIFLSVDINNIAAIKSYRKSGFITTNNHPLGKRKNDNYNGIDMVQSVKSSKAKPKN